jgi:CheY-like chemotaxis protein
MTDATILLVEDEPIIGKAIEARLVQLGYSVSGVCDNVDDAIQMAAESKPNIVLMDIMLDGKSDGIEAARQIQSLFNIPVVFLTCYSDAVSVAKAKLANPHGCIGNPFDPLTLRATVEKGLRGRRTEFKELVSASA